MERRRPRLHYGSQASRLQLQLILDRMKYPSLAFILAALFVTMPLFAGQKPNVLLITIDTLRADRIGCYGYTQAQTPTIDRLAAEGIVFTNAVSHVPLTRPSHTSIFTGLLPYEHDVHDNVAPPLKKDIPTLAEVLHKNGYTTAAFVASFVVNSQSGLDRGFDLYEDRIDPAKQPTQFALNLEKRGEDVYQEFVEWFHQKKSGPYFAWIHLYDPHFPYEPPAPFSTKFADRPYDGEVAYADSIVSRIVKQIGLNTVLIIASDHGESLGDHGENAHSFFIYDSTLSVPWIIRWPGVLKAGRKIPIQVRLIDLYPTVLDLLQIPLPRKVSGISLKPWLLVPETADPQLFSYCETFTPWLHFGWSKLQGVRANGWKYIEAPRAELFDLKRDPGEMNNSLSANRAKAQELKQWLSKSGALQMKAAAPSEMDPETIEKLASLGYAGVAPPSQSSASLPDPKDKIADFKLFNQLIREGIEAFQNERYSEAAAKFQELKDRQIPSFEIHYYLGRSLLRLKSYDKARTELETALRALPHFLPAYRDLSEAWEGMKNPKEAEKALLAGLAVSPNHPTLVQPLAWLYQRQKNFGAAEKLLAEELKARPDNLESRFRLGSIYRDTGRPADAIRQFQEIISRSPEDAEAHNQLGMLYGGTNRMEEAVAQFSEAARLAPKDDLIRQNLELAQRKVGEQVRFRIIQTKTRAAAEAILRKMQNGETWESLASQYSIHASARSQQPVIEAHPDEIEAPLALALSKLKSGQTSGVIETSNGFFLLRRE